MFVMLSEAKHLPIASVAHEQLKDITRECARFLAPLGMTREGKFGQ